MYTTDLENRTPVWIALSAFYLDTELTDAQLEHIARVIACSPYSLDMAKEIDKTEVFPVLHYNLLSVAGEWAYFDPQWTADAICRYIWKNGGQMTAGARIRYFVHGGANTAYWKAVEKHYLQLKTAQQ